MKNSPKKSPQQANVQQGASECYPLRAMVGSAPASTRRLTDLFRLLVQLKPH
jgi:hypothetical protein